MISTAALIFLITLVTGFYGRFLVALCKEMRRFKACYLVRLEIRPDDLQIDEEPEMDESAPIAA